MPTLPEIEAFFPGVAGKLRFSKNLLPLQRSHPASSRGAAMTNDVNVDNNSVSTLPKMAAVDDEDDDNDDVGHPSSSYHLYDGIDTIPSDATHVRVGPAVTTIRGDAFLPARSVLRRVVLPDGLRRVGRHAFRKLVSLERIDLPDSVDEIEPEAFAGCSFTNFRVPTAMTHFDIVIFPAIFPGPNSIVSVEVPEGVVLVTHDPGGPVWSWNAELDVLRNVAIPPGCLVEPIAFGKFTDLWAALLPPGVNDDYESINDARALGFNTLQRRFEGLPIHGICYRQCHQDAATVMRDLRREINPWLPSSGNSRFLGRLNETGRRRDCLGMTPLHILACSSRHDIEMFRLVVGKYPGNLVTEDGWGDIPLLYAFWCDAPDEIIRYLVECYTTMHPEYILDWGGMIRVLAEGRAPPSRVRNLLDAHRRCSPATHARDFRDVISGLARSHDTRVSTLRRPRTSSETFRFLLRDVVSRRVDSCGIGRWRVEVANAVDDINLFRLSDDDWERRTRVVYAGLDLCESLKESAAILELALWKARIRGEGGDYGGGGGGRRGKRTQLDRRERCRISCGADVVVCNVLIYLWPGMGRIHI